MEIIGVIDKNSSLIGKEAILLVQDEDTMNKLKTREEYTNVQFISKGKRGITVFAIMGDMTLDELQNDKDILRYDISYNKYGYVK